MSCKSKSVQENGPEAEKMLEAEKMMEAEKMLGNNAPRRLTEFCATLPLTDDTSCGIGCCRGPTLQRFANKKAFVILYGILGCIFSACYAYFNGTITTIEKRFRISSKTTAKEKHSILCQSEKGKLDCNKEDGSIAPAVILFTAQIISGFGGSLYYTLGVSYMDDNIKKSKTPALISFSYFIRMLGPAIGYSLASLCLKFYISPMLTPTITTADPRWLGAWWLGWLILATLLAIAASLLALFPKQLPRAAARRLFALERTKSVETGEKADAEVQASLSDLLMTFKRLIMNPTLTCNNLASVFYFIGFLPYWIFLPKYIETMYKQSASFASLITGTVGLVFSAIGILVSGIVITKFKPTARCLALWNVFVGVVSIAGIISYIFLGCADNDNHMAILGNGELETKVACNQECNCDYVKYSPVCSPDKKTYISPCHAGCHSYQRFPNGTKMFTDCNCVPLSSPTELPDLKGLSDTFDADLSTSFYGNVKAGACPIDCSAKFYMFLLVCCFLKFTIATGRTSNFLVSVRCVEEKDKTVAIALSMTVVSLLAFIPSPILFGYIMDQNCLVWGKTCTGTGNCWLYNGELLRIILNVTSACFVTIGTLFDGGVWFYVKDLKVFDDDDEEENGKKTVKR
ncbi:organic anion transporting polypeptide 58Dc isoform X2 [Lycorma delicatula]|uniref:organic anion transporting polypeptide 58Dc isoform X2 n=1 Tax=Lycorma delicatula TaxID=130591 RepID=UPI003F50D847